MKAMNSIRQWTVVAFIIFMALSLAACGSSVDAERLDKLQQYAQQLCAKNEGFAWMSLTHHWNLGSNGGVAELHCNNGASFAYPHLQED